MYINFILRFVLPLTQQYCDYYISNKKNLRILTVNCRSIRDKNAEFHVALNYTKPDIVLGTESWLKGIKPGKNATRCNKIMPKFPRQLHSIQKRQRYTGRRRFHHGQQRHHISRKNRIHYQLRNRMGQHKIKKQQRPTNWVLLHAT